jgi:DNA-binding transcriptional ArsR family regulator
LVWVTLEEVALDAVAEDGRWVARTSARQVAERLGIDPGTANNALRDLRRDGLLTLEREHGPAGRFGLSVYVIGSIPGLTVVSPRVVEPGVAQPHIVRAAGRPGSSSAQSGRAGPEAPASPLQRVEQEALDLGCPS